MNRRIVVICCVMMIGLWVFLYFAIFREGFFQSSYVFLALAALFVWLAGGAATLAWTILSFSKRIDALASGSVPVERTFRARR